MQTHHHCKELVLGGKLVDSSQCTSMVIVQASPLVPLSLAVVRWGLEAVPGWWELWALGIWKALLGQQVQVLEACTPLAFHTMEKHPNLTRKPEETQAVAPSTLQRVG